jgi:hypothetical protein
MPYQLKEGKDPLKIAEQEYSSGPKLKFTNFTSCIAVIAKKGEMLTGVHLVAIGNGGVFMPTDVNRVHNLLPTPADKITVFGFIDDWRSGLNGEQIKIATLKLTGELKLTSRTGGRTLLRGSKRMTAHTAQKLLMAKLESPKDSERKYTEVQG